MSAGKPKKETPWAEQQRTRLGKESKEPIRERETFLPCRIWNSGLAYGAGRMRGVFSFDLARVERTGAPRAAEVAVAAAKQQSSRGCVWAWVPESKAWWVSPT